LVIVLRGPFCGSIPEKVVQGENMYLQWSEAFDIGVPLIDRQHRRLAELLNAVHDSHAKNGSVSSMHLLFNALVRYAEEHFRSEEALMEETRYPDLGRQKREHQRFTFAIFALNQKYEAGDAEAKEETLAFLKTWLLDHILQMDRKMGEHVQERGVPEFWQRHDI
jgi:hemerythrin-like metal-binding protein